METSKLMRLGITAGALYFAWRFAPNATIKTMVLGVAGVAIIRNTPVVQDYVAI